jgi:Dolichyl-phosphate-mannose-protein mannosyltransferase
MVHTALAILAIYVAARMARWVPLPEWLTRIGEPLNSRWAPAVFGAITAALVWWVAGSMTRPPVIHDEAAYLLQAGIFARGRWTLPGPPFPEFFEQFHVLVVPALAAKYPPGQALALTPGVWLGLPELMPVLLSGLTGALIFALARRVAGGWVGLLTWIVWVGAMPSIYRRATYLSEDTTSAAWLLAWWALLDWRARGRTRSLVAVGIAVGVVAITRPLTAVALVVPIAVVVLWTAWRRRVWRPLAVAAVAGTAVVAILPVWNARVTGDWRVSPLAVYTRAYLPWDRPGFGAETPRATRPLPADLLAVGSVFYTWHKDYAPAALPSLLVKRLYAVGVDMWAGPALVLLPFALLGFGFLGVEGWFAMASFASLVACYLCYAYPSPYTVYYLEAEPVLAFLTGLGVVATIAAVARRPRAQLGAGATLVVFGVAVAATWWAVPTPRAERDMDMIEIGYHRAVESVFAKIHDPKAIVFVRYGPGHNPNMSLVHNLPDPLHAPLWVVYDRGADNARLMRLARDRAAYLFDEDAWTLTRIGAAAP